MIPGLLGGGQIDPWRQQLQQMYGQGVFGSHQGHEAYSGPSTMQAYAMSGQGRYLNPASTQTPANPGIDPTIGAGGFNMGGGIAGVIQQFLAQQRAQQQNGSGGNVKIPSNPLAPIRQPGGGLLGAY